MALDIIGSAADLLAVTSHVLEVAKRRETVVRILKAIGIDPNETPNDFDKLYAYTLVEYGVGKPPPLITFFRNSIIKDLVKQAIEKQDMSLLEEEAHAFLEWSDEGPTLAKLEIEPRRELTTFLAILKTTAQHTRTMKEIKQEQLLIEILDMLQEIVRQTDISDMQRQLDEIQTSISRTSEWTHERRRRLFRLPFPQNADFIGREKELVWIHQQLIGGTDPLSGKVGVVGMAGIGKTQLAIEYAYRFQRSYPRGIYWINGAEAVVDEFYRVADEDYNHDFGTPASTPFQALNNFFNGEGNLLLIIDNLDDLRKLSQPILNGRTIVESSFYVLFTSRSKLPLPTVQYITLSPFAEKDAYTYIMRTIGNRLLEEEVEHTYLLKDLCRAIGYLPLALSLAVSYLRNHPKTSLTDYAERLIAENPVNILDQTVDRTSLAENHILHSLRVALTTQVSGLGSYDSRKLLDIIALLPEADYVPTEILELIVKFQDDTDEQPIRLLSALRQLVSNHLLEELQAGQVRLHPLVHAFIRESLESEPAVDLAVQCALSLLAKMEDMNFLDRFVVTHDSHILQDYLHKILKLVSDEFNLLEEDSWKAYQTKVRDLQRRILALIHLLQQESTTIDIWRQGRHSNLFLQQVMNRALQVGLLAISNSASSALENSLTPFFRLRWHIGKRSPFLRHTITAHNHWVNDIVFHPNSAEFFSASEDALIRIWDKRTGELKRTLEGHRGPVNCIDISSDGRLLVSGSDDNTVRIWDLQKNTLRHNLIGHNDWVRCVSIVSEKGLIISGSEDRTVRIWCLDTGELTAVYRKHPHWVRTVAVSPDQKMVASGGDDGIIHIWDLDTVKQISQFSGHTHPIRAVKFIDHQHIVSASEDFTIRVWNIIQNSMELELLGHYDWVVSIDVSPDKEWIVSASHDKTIRLWNWRAKKLIATLTGHTGPIRSVKFDTDGTSIITAARDNTVRLWSVPKKNSVVNYQTERKLMPSQLPSIVIEGHIAFTEPDGTVVVTDVETGHISKILPGHQVPVTCLAYESRRRVLLTAYEDATIKIWNMNTGDEAVSFKGHSQTINDMCVDSFTGTSFSVSEDCTLRAWNIDSGSEVSIAVVDRPLRSISILDAHQSIVTTDEIGVMYCFDLIVQ